MQGSPLAELKDIHLPEPTSMWPPAYGWWILLAVVIGLIIALIIWQVRRWRSNLAKRQAIAELEMLTTNSENWPQHLHKLMRRLTVSYFPQENVAQLHGQHWVQFLMSQLKPNQYEKCQAELQSLVNAQYQPNADNLDIEKQKAAAKYWINQTLPPKQQKAANTPQPITNEVHSNV